MPGVRLNSCFGSACEAAQRGIGRIQFLMSQARQLQSTNTSHSFCPPVSMYAGRYAGIAAAAAQDAQQGPSRSAPGITSRVWK